MKVAIHNLIVEIPDKEKKFYGHSWGLTKEEIVDQALNMWVWKDHPEQLSFDDIHKDERELIKKIVTNALSSELCQSHMDNIEDAKGDYLYENRFCDAVMEIEEKLINKVLQNSEEFQAFRLLHI